MRKRIAMILWGLFFALVPAPGCVSHGGDFQRDFQTIDPSGQWYSLQGVLSLMLTGDALSFSYSAVFGATAHICDGAGVAGLVKNGEYQYADEQGTVSFLVDGRGVRMQTAEGIVSFCGANWPGDTFTKDGYKPAEACHVAAEKSWFHVVMPSPPEKRKGYVIKGDRLETVPACHEGGDQWVLARYKGTKVTTVGLVRKDTLECP
ncbi:MAG: hypothetical protein R2941_22345 [Desulfobacterales bacterium]